MFYNWNHVFRVLVFGDYQKRPTLVSFNPNTFLPMLVSPLATYLYNSSRGSTDFLSAFMKNAPFSKTKLRMRNKLFSTCKSAYIKVSFLHMQPPVTNKVTSGDNCRGFF